MADPALRRLTAVVSAFREKHQEMQMQQAHTLLAIAARPGIAQGELVSTVGISQSAISRNIQALSDGNSKGMVGLKLVDARLNPHDYRATCHYLTVAGRAFVLDLLGCLQDAPTAVDVARR